jgi:hypothetical protein
MMIRCNSHDPKRESSPGILSEALGIKDIYLTDIDSPKEFELEKQRSDPRFISWPTIRLFPDNSLIEQKKVLIVGCGWGTGRCISAVRNRVSGGGGVPFTCVLHITSEGICFP